MTETVITILQGSESTQTMLGEIIINIIIANLCSICLQKYENGLTCDKANIKW